MYKIPQVLMIISLFLLPHTLPAQTFASVTYTVGSTEDGDDENEIALAQKMADEAQITFRVFLEKTSMDENIRKQLLSFCTKETDALQNTVSHMATSSQARRAKGIRSISYFMKEMQRQLSDKKFNQFKVPEILKKYKQTLTALLSRKPSEPLEKNFKGIGWRSSQLLANSFWQFDEKDQMNDISNYKRIVKTPNYIFSYLESKPDFRYTDSLIVFMAKNEPDLLISYLKQHNNSVTSRIKKNDDQYVKALVSYSDNSLASELAPFTEQIVNNEITVDQVLEQRKKVTPYFQLLVDKVMLNEEKKAAKENPQFQKALRNSMHDKSLDFYVKKINELHNSSDAVRFESVQSLRPQDLYYIIVSSDDEMFTSTYLGLYKRLLAKYDNSADELLATVHYDKFRKFMREAASYSTLTDFLHHMPAAKSQELIHLFISDIEDDDEDEAVSNATDIADAFINLSRDPELNKYVQSEITASLDKSRKENLFQAQRLYSILQQVYDVVNKQQDNHGLAANYMELPVKTLKDDNGTINELVVFYGDEDGKASFASFMNLFKDKSRWEVKTNESWTSIHSLQGQPIRIYANLPLDDKDEKDVAAQGALISYLKKESIEPSVLIHRGHSYHLSQTLKYLQPSMKLAILGSCGGYRNMKSVIDVNPDMHIVASKQVGSMAVNDPLLRQLNNDLNNKKDINWLNFWTDLGDSFKGNAETYKLFEEYVPPYKNVSSFVVKLYNYNDDNDRAAAKL
jgi:hypothetical protein